MAEWNPTLQQMKFVEEYVKDMDGKRAALAVGYRHNRHKTLLKDERILMLINKALRDNGIVAGPTIPRILQELMRIAFFDPKDLYHENGDPRDLSDIPEDARRCISGIEFAIEGKGEYATTIKKYKILDKHKALENLGRHLAMFTDKMKVDVNTELENMNDDQLRDTIRQLADKAGVDIRTSEAPETKH